MNALPRQSPDYWISDAITALHIALILAKSPDEVSKIQFSLQNLRNLLVLLKKP